MSAVNQPVRIASGIGGAVIGGAIGYFAFLFLAKQGFYAMILPGALLGLGCGLASGMKSNILGIACGFAALVLSVFTEWRFAPFVADNSFEFFVKNLGELRTVTKVLIALGGFAGYWFGRGRDRPASHHFRAAPPRDRDDDLGEDVT